MGKREPDRACVYLRDGKGELLPWLESVADDQRRKHPGRGVTIAGIVREALLLARQSKEIDEKLRR